MPFEGFFNRVNTILPSQFLLVNELKDDFFPLKTNTSPGADEKNFNVIKHCFGDLCGPLKYLFDSSLESGLFPDLMKIAIVSPVFKIFDSANISNYPPISVPPCFSKILEHNVQSSIQILNWSESITPTTVWLPKRLLYRTCKC